MPRKSKKKQALRADHVGVDEETVFDATWNQLIEQAKQVSSRAWCPYSRFAVGAAVVSRTGQAFAGCNVENASYGLAVCAERNAVFQAVAHGHRELDRVVVYTPTEKPTAPCGACRQVLYEFGPGMDVLCVCDSQRVIRLRLDQLLPKAFGADFCSTPRVERSGL